MSLRTSHTSANKVIDTGLVVTYSRQKISGSWGWTNDMNAGGTYTHMQEYHRRATMSYRYVGMTTNAKNACVADLISKFTVDVRTPEWQSNGSWSSPNVVGRMLIASIAPVHNEDGSWDVVVNVNHDAVRWTMENSINIYPRTLFAFEVETDYDGETEPEPPTPTP